MSSIQDLQFRFSAEGRTYVVEVRAPGKRADPVHDASIDAQIVVDAPKDFADYDGEEPDVVVCQLVDYVRPVVPASVNAGLWDWMADAVLAWVEAHRDADARAEWELERHELESCGTESTPEP